MNETNKPKVVFWFKIYCGVLVAIYVLVIIVSIAYLLFPPETFGISPTLQITTGSLMLLIGVVLAAAFALPIFLKKHSWMWIYGLILIAFGMTSLPFLPFCVALLVFWLKEPTRMYYDWK